MISSLLFLILSSHLLSVSEPAQQFLVGTVVARYAPGSNPNSTENVEVFIVRTARWHGKPVYAKIEYRWDLETERLPDEFFTRSRPWKLKVGRTPDCDGTLESMAEQVVDPRTGQPTADRKLALEVIAGAESEHVSLSTPLLCYRLVPGGWIRLHGK